MDNILIVCVNCGHRKSENSFGKCKDKLNGRQSWCKACSGPKDPNIYADAIMIRLNLQDGDY